MELPSNSDAGAAPPMPVTSIKNPGDAAKQHKGTRRAGIAKCRNVWIVPDMPKTRSGKIMRRVLGAISNKGDVGNVMTLANPEIVEEIQKMVAE